MAAGKYLVRVGALGALMMVALMITNGPLAAQAAQGVDFSAADSFPVGGGPAGG